jgi:hypothetical protein
MRARSCSTAARPVSARDRSRAYALPHSLSQKRGILNRKRHILLVTSAAQAGREAEYDQWYDSTHLADICSIPGVVSGRRFDAAPASPSPTPARCLAIFEIEADDPLSVLAEMNRRASSGEMSVSAALDPAAVQMWLYACH